MIDIFWCKNCLNTSTRPRISFDNQGFCNACQWAQQKKKINWKKREYQLLKLLDKHRSNSNRFDCLVPVSGGKDGSYVAYQLKHKYGMNPLTVTSRPPLTREIGDINLENFIRSGYDHIHISANSNSMKAKARFVRNPKTKRALRRSMQKARGDLKQGEAGSKTRPISKAWQGLVFPREIVCLGRLTSR
jgi:hypothetical protein